AERRRAGVGAMGVAEIKEQPGAPEIGVGDPLAVLIDEVEWAADRAAEPGARRAARAVAQSDREKSAGGDEDESGADERGEQRARQGVGRAGCHSRSALSAPAPAGPRRPPSRPRPSPSASRPWRRSGSRENSDPRAAAP